MEIPLVKNIPNLHVYHLKIKFDEINDVLLYDRTLEKGSGPAVYGLEVCKAMDLGNDFISQAKQAGTKILTNCKYWSQGHFLGKLWVQWHIGLNTHSRPTK